MKHANKCRGVRVAVQIQAWFCPTFFRGRTSSAFREEDAVSLLEVKPQRRVWQNVKLVCGWFFPAAAESLRTLNRVVPPHGLHSNVFPFKISRKRVRLLYILIVIASTLQTVPWETGNFRHCFRVMFVARLGLGTSPKNEMTDVLRQSKQRGVLIFTRKCMCNYLRAKFKRERFSTASTAATLSFQKQSSWQKLESGPSVIPISQATTRRRKQTLNMPSTS